MPTKAKRTTTAPEMDPLHTLKLQHHSMCQHPYPVCTSPATVVDYVIPLTEGGHNDWHNLQSHCTAHQDQRPK
jgi:5-methylcytosine-specific restriction endonuclease McrA